jgi:hypothetical protein
MNCFRSFNFALAALIPAAAISLGIAGALAQAPPAAAPPAASTPATPAPAPATPPTKAETPAPTPPPVVAPVQTADPFGEEIVLTPKTAVIVKGTANWDSAFDTLMDSFKALSALLDKQGIKPAGNAMIVYTSTDDTGFTFQAEIPIDQEPNPLKTAEDKLVINVYVPLK